MQGYRLLSYATGAAPGSRPARAGVLLGGDVLDAEEALSGRLDSRAGVDCSSVLSLLRAWEDVRPALEALAQEGPGGLRTRALHTLRLAAPILFPDAVFGAGANYADHVLEMTGKPPPDKATARPFFFLKTTAHSIVGPGEPIRLPDFSKQIDWEAEIGVVIGRAARNVREEQALDHVAGYLIVDDLSARDAFRRSDTSFVFDWIGQKCFDTSCPMGPWITPASEIPDPQDLAIRLWRNDTLMQDSSSRHMIFGVAEQIAHLSRQITLRPGDVLATGTPAGVGRPRGVFLEPGDRVRIEIEGLGELDNPVVREECETGPRGPQE